MNYQMLLTVIITAVLSGIISVTVGSVIENRTPLIARDASHSFISSIYPHPLIGVAVSHISNPDETLGVVVWIDGSGMAKVFKPRSGKIKRYRLECLTPADEL